MSADEMNTHKKKNADITESEELFSATFEQAAVGIAHVAPDGRWLRVNQKLCEIVGYSKDELMKLTFQDITFQDDLDTDLEYVRRMLAGEIKSYSMEKRYIRKDKSIVWINLTVSLVRKPSGEPKYFISVVEDITTRKKTETELHKSEELIAQLKRVEAALRESESRFRIIVESDPDCVNIVSIDGQLLDMNPAGLRIIEAGDGAEILGRQIIELVHPEDRPTYLKLQHEVILGGTGQIQYRIVSLKGTERWIDGHSVALRADDGSVSSILNVLHDITARKRGEEKLRASEELYRSLFENMMNGFAYCKMLFDQGRPQDFIYLEVNSAFESLTGLKNVVGKKVSEVIPGIRESDPMLLEIYGRVALTGKPETFEIYVEALKMWFSISVYSPKKEYFVAVFDVISERKQAEEEKARLLAIIEESPDFIGVADLQGNLQYHNLAAKKMVGLPENADLTHLKIRDMHPGWAAKLVEEEGIPTILREGSWKRENALLHRNGSEIPVSQVLVIHRDSSGEPKFISTIMRDITENRKLENQLRQSQKMEAVGQLAGGIAHDFNNILTAITGYGYIALMKMAKDDPSRLDIEHMLEGVDRAAYLTKDILLFSRKHTINKNPVDLNEVVRLVEKFLKRVIGEDIDYKTVLQEKPIPVLADSHHIEQVLMNLATNACDAMSNGGLFTITTEKVTLNQDFISAHGYGKPGEYAMITISDTGMGMDEETRKRIFEPFFTTKEVGKGTGLGLAVVYGIIKEHDGYINVYSEPSKGTTFRIYLPVIALELKKEAKVHQKEAYNQGTETILVVEDDASLRNLSKTVLTEFGYTVIEAVDGEDAVKKFMENKDRIHLILSDLIMPKMNGKEACEEMLKMKPDMKIIFMSGYAPDIIRKKVLLGEGSHMIFKPMSPHDLLKKIRNVLDNGKHI